MGFNKCRVSCTYHCRSIQNSFTALNNKQQNPSVLPINTLSSPNSLFLFHFPNRNVLDITASHPSPLQQHVHIYKLMWFSLQSWVFRLSRWLNEIQNKWLGQALTKWWCWHCNVCLLTLVWCSFCYKTLLPHFQQGEKWLCIETRREDRNGGTLREDFTLKI